MRRKDTSIFKSEVLNLVDSEYTVLGEYVNSQTKLKMKHNTCDHEYMVKPNKFLEGKRCPKCNRNYKKDTKIFIEEVNSLTSGEYEVLGEYVLNSVPIEIKHLTCGATYEVRPSFFTSKGQRCSHCNKKRGNLKIEKYLKNKNIEYYKDRNLKSYNGIKVSFYIPSHKMIVEYDDLHHFETSDYFGGMSNYLDIIDEDFKKNMIAERYGLKMVRISYIDFNNIEKILNTFLKD